MSTHPKELQAALAAWFRANARDLPWRKEYAPYRVWISEVMLQQTQMQRGVSYFLRWMTLFPTVFDVAQAKEADILRAWEGLGYYRRARNLHACAQKIVHDYQGEFPRTYEELCTLPGIGPYTAAAIASIAFLEPVACIDANVERVLSRIYDIPDDIQRSAGRERLEAYASALVHAASPRETNQALMEFGSLVCGKKPVCVTCPLASSCLALAHGVVLERPVKRRQERSKKKTVAAALLFVNGDLLVQTPRREGIWAGLHTLPQCDVPEGRAPADALCSFLSTLLAFPLTQGTWHHSLKHAYTTWTIALTGFAFTANAQTPLPEGYSFVPSSAISSIPLPSPHRSLLRSYLAAQHALF